MIGAADFDNPLRDVLDQHGECHLISYMVYCDLTDADLDALNQGISFFHTNGFYIDLEYINLKTAIDMEVYRGSKISFMFVESDDSIMETMPSWIEEGMEALRIRHEFIETKEVKADV